MKAYKTRALRPKIVSNSKKPKSIINHRTAATVTGKSAVVYAPLFSKFNLHLFKDLWESRNKRSHEYFYVGEEREHHQRWEEFQAASRNYMFRV